METKQSPLDCARLGCGDPGSGTFAGTLASSLASTAIKQKLNFGVESILGPQRSSAPSPRHDAPPPLARPRPRPSSPPPSPVSLVRAPPPPVKLSPAPAPLLQLVAPPPPHSEGGSLALLGLGRAPESLPLVGAGARLPGLASVASLSSPLLLPPHSVLGSPFLSPPLSPAPWYTGAALSITLQRL